MKKGWVGLDIDGTITTDKYTILPPVKRFFKKLAQKNWGLGFFTGRTFAFSQPLFDQFDFPFFFSPQNGSAILKMPEKQCIRKEYMDPAALAFIEKAFEDVQGDFIVYGGYEKQDRCYYRPHKFKHHHIDYINHLKDRQQEPWETLKDFIPEKMEEFSLVKGFGSQEEMLKVKNRLEESRQFQLALIRDPFLEGYYILHINSLKGSKGLALTFLSRKYGSEGPLISAGDDDNDLSMFEVCDVSISMKKAPEHVRKKAQMISEPEEKLIQTLTDVISQYDASF